MALLLRNCNIMKSHNYSLARFKLIGTIAFLIKVNLSFVIYHLIYLTFLVNLLNQPFESTFLMNLECNWRCH